MARPISPFLSIYKPQIGSIFSIFERISGLFLLLCLYLFLGLLNLEQLLAADYHIYRFFFWFFKEGFSSFSFCTFYFFCVLLFSYHIAFGFRYLVWHFSGGDFKQASLDLAGLYNISQFIFGFSLATVLISLLT
jgi:succinate dehydrogenase cytochrome b556 subunit